MQIIIVVAKIAKRKFINVIVEVGRTLRKRKEGCGYDCTMQIAYSSEAFQTMFSALLNKDPSIFHNHMRMSPSLFKDLLLMVGPSIKKVHFLREALSAKQKMAITIR